MITASIVTYHHSLTEIKTVLNCILNSPIALLYIIDNSSNDFLRILERSDSRIRYVHSVNIGYGSAHNIAIREAVNIDSRYHVVINPDIYFDVGTIEKLIEHMEDNPNVGQIMPKVFYPDGRLQHLCKLIPTPLDLLLKRFLPLYLTKKRMCKFQMQFTRYNTIMNVPYLSGCFMLFRISSLKKIGFFDERFFMYPEDIDISRRMHREYQTIFYPYASIIHAHAAASKTNIKMLKIHIWNIIKYFNKWGWFFDSERKVMNKRVLKEISDKYKS